MTDWTWGNEGVTIEGTNLIWYEQLGAVSFASGAAKEQSIADFLANGPAVWGVPADVVLALTAALSR